MQITLGKISNRLSEIDLGKAGIWLLFGILVMGMSLFFGLLAVTASPILVGMGAGLIIGIFFLTRPHWIVWLIIILGLVSGVFISQLGPVASKLPWVISIFGFLLLPLAVIQMVAGKSRIPSFAWLALGFLLYSVLVTLIHWHSFGEFVSGFKHYFQVYGLLLALVAMNFKPEYFAGWKKAFVWIALLQLPFALYEYFVLVPARGGMGAGEVTDVVAGTLGANIKGGSPNSIMVTFLIIVFGFAMAQWRERLIRTSTLFLVGIFCFAPMFLGATKIVLLLLPTAALIILRGDIVKNPARFFMLSLLGALLFSALSYIYFEVLSDKSFYDSLYEMYSYNFLDKGYGLSKLNRTTVYSFWYEHHGDVATLLIGNGLGSSYIGQYTLVPGHVALQYPNYGVGLTTASTILWDVGVVGLALFVAIFVSALRVANTLYREAGDAAMRANALAIQASLAMFIVHIVYLDSLVLLPSFQIMLAFVLGYLAFLYKHRHASQ